MSAPRPPGVPPAAGTLLALDHSKAATGVAIGSVELGSARPLTVLRMKDEDQRLAALAALMQEWAPVAWVVGLPLDRDGGEQAQTRRVRRLADRLQAQTGLPLFFHDERYTTVVAEDTLRQSGLRADAVARHADAQAAREILQGYLDALQSSNAAPRT